MYTRPSMLPTNITNLYESRQKIDSVNINLPLTKIFYSNDIKSLMSGDEHHFSGGAVKARYEQKYSLIRVYIDNKPDPVNIYLQDGNVKNIVSTEGGTQSKLHILVERGFLTRAVLENAASTTTSEVVTPKSSIMEDITPSSVVGTNSSRPSIMERIIPSSPNSLGRYVVVAAGPGGTAFSIDNVRTVNANIAKHGANGVAHYHYASSAPMTVMADAINSLSEKEKSNNKLTLFVMAHGEIKDGKFLINLDGEYKASREIFSEINSKISKPIDIFLTSCYGSGVFLDVEFLPKGSTLAVLSLRDSPSLGKDIDLLYESLSKVSDMSAKNILLLHCTLTKNRSPSAIHIDGTTYQLERLMKNRLGRSLTDAKRNMIHQALDKLSSPQRINAVMQKMESARDDSGIDAVDYGMSLAIAASLDLP